jgi:lysyl-tRNA synthetase class 1
MFNETMINVVQKYDALMDLMLKNLGEERQETYSPIMPISPLSGRVLETGVKGVNKDKNTVIFVDEDGVEREISVLDGNCKLQWKIDFGARWKSFDVDYEIFGKDHMPNEKIYKEVCKILGGVPPINYWYELFLGEDGAKISKSKGNGISVEQWLKYAPKQSMGLFMYTKPKTAKRLYFDVIPKYADEYIQYSESYAKQGEPEKYENPCFYVDFEKNEQINLGGINYSLLLNLASACNPENPSVLWGFIEKYNPQLKPGVIKILDDMVATSINYYNDFIKPNKKFKNPSDEESQAIAKLLQKIEELNLQGKIDGKNDSESYQNAVYLVGKEAGFEIKSWFTAIYEILLGQSSGPRVGSFINIFGVENFKNLCKEKCKI